MATGPTSPGTTSKMLPDFSDFTKLFSEMKLPGVMGMDSFVAASRRNMETLTAAHRVALEGAQAVGRRHMEIMQQSMTEMADAMRTLSTTETPQARASRQADLLKQAYERSVTNMKEIGDLIQQSNTEAMEVLNKRFTEAMDEVKALADQSSRP